MSFAYCAVGRGDLLVFDNYCWPNKFGPTRLIYPPDFEEELHHLNNLIEGLLKRGKGTLNIV